ncbi:MAG: transcription elongation factor GreA [Ruminococcaceae bacterium]|jgi:transcription elongation factor GreA|nr:transcription elongation factor GreA [Oscillospiraceae bacterium]
MNDELTKVDIEKMKAELEDRRLNIRPKIMEDVKTARAFGDLSENYEYKAAKEAQRRNDSRMRYLERMIATAKVIDAPRTADDVVGLFSTVTMFNEKLGKEQTIRIVTTLRQDALHGLISKESPVAKALMGHKTGDRVEIAVSPEMKYTVEIRSVEPGTDDASLAISSF